MHDRYWALFRNLMQFFVAEYSKSWIIYCESWDSILVKWEESWSYFSYNIWISATIEKEVTWGVI